MQTTHIILQINDSTLYHLSLWGGYMKRIEKVLNYLKKQTELLSEDDILNGKGVTTFEIAENLDILRTNVSKELNELHRLGEIIKIKGRPVLYLHKLTIENKFNIKLPNKMLEIDNIKDIIKIERENNYTNDDPFSLLIGADGSLKNQIEQAKAAILYPPNGLHTLIIGQTGVGKTLLANLMYMYAKYINKLNEKSPFIVFNCADYYNNPQLLISHIFGHIKGAFTGADYEKTGLIEKANGGILFLDEIHRLPPEGQEMLFYFMDTGIYSKLVETERVRKASVLILCATTEDIDSFLLKTFIRRIPIVINIPSFEERPIKEKIDIIKHLLSQESSRVNKPIKISSDVVKALIGSCSYGNVGQLKSNIQLICAKGFLNCINTNNEYIELDFKTLPNNVKEGFFNLKRKDFEEIEIIMQSSLLVNSNNYKVLIEEDPYKIPFNLYKIIEDKANLLRHEGVNEEYIHKFITIDINTYIKSFYNKFNKNENKNEKLLKIVGKDK